VRRKQKKIVGPMFGGGMEDLQEWRLGGGLGGVCKMKACLEALLEIDFSKNPSHNRKVHFFLSPTVQSCIEIHASTLIY
jgi:hypothetical protein